MGDPADGPRQGEDHGEHAGWNADRLEDDPRVEVDVRVQRAFDEVRVGQGDLFQAHGQFELRIVLDAQFLQHFVAGLLHHGGTWIAVFVNAVTEAHQFERIVLVLGLGDELVDVRNIADFIEHGQYGFVRTAVGRAPQCSDTGGDTGERVGARRTRQAHGGRRGVLLVVGMEDEDPVHGLGEYRADRFDLARGVEHHVQEVFRVRQVVARVHHGLAHGVLVNHRCQGRHLGNQADRGDFAMLRVIDVQGVVVEGREGADYAAHDGHRVGVATEAVEEGLQLLVNHGVVLHGADELGLLFCGRQFAVEQQIAGFQVVRLFSQLFDRVAAVQQNAVVAVDIGDLRLAGSGRHETRVKGETARGRQAPNIDNIGTNGAG
ncbi:hypothetical protein D3C73_468080 [compost metagenome]